jgi:hypothetical protein
VEGGLDDPEHATVVVNVANGGDETEVREKHGEGGVAIGTMGSALLLRLHVLGPTAVDGSPVVRAIVQVDRHIDGVVREIRLDLATEGEREGALDLPPFQMLEMMASGPIRYAAAALNSGTGDRDASGSGSEEEVDGLAKGGEGEALGEGGHEQGESPVEGPPTDLPVGEGARSPSAPEGR